jgi:hypothetical protein
METLSMTDAQMIELIQSTMKAQYEADTYSSDEPTEASPHSPASPEAIGRFEESLNRRGLPLPPSFAQFLSLHNGIDDYVRGLSIRSIQAIEESREKDMRWKETTSIYPFIFADGEYTSSIAGFVPGTEDACGEMNVLVLSERGEPNEYESFGEFLEDQLSFYLDVLEAEKADRQDLKDD